MSKKANRLIFKSFGEIKYLTGKKRKPISPYVYPILKNIEFYRKSELESFSIKEIEEAVLGNYNVDKDFITCKRSRGLRTEIKRVMTYLLYEKTSLSFKEIGDYFGNSDHTSAIYNYEKYKDALKKNPQKIVDLNIILNKLMKHGWQEA